MYSVFVPMLSCNLFTVLFLLFIYTIILLLFM